MSNQEESAEELLKRLGPEDVQWLLWLVRIGRMVNGWCSVNRAIAKWIIFTGIAALVVLSQGVDALHRAAAFFRALVQGGH